MKNTFPIIEKAYLVGTHHYCFRAGTPSEIIKVVVGTPDKKSSPRICYEVEYSDGIKDYVPISEVGINYEIITFKDIIKGKFKKNN